jgi:hypothetical protein
VVDCPLRLKSTKKQQFHLVTTMADLLGHRNSRGTNEIHNSSLGSRLCPSNQQIIFLQDDAAQQLKFHRFQLSAPGWLQIQN